MGFFKAKTQNNINDPGQARQFQSTTYIVYTKYADSIWVYWLYSWMH